MNRITPTPGPRYPLTLIAAFLTLMLLLANPDVVVIAAWFVLLGGLGWWLYLYGPSIPALLRIRKEET